MAVASRPDVIVMDLSMPMLDGWAAIRAMKRHRGTARIPIIACTGHVEGGSGEAAIDAGCDAYLLKPCLPEHLLKEIRTQLARASQRRAQSALAAASIPEPPARSSARGSAISAT